MSSSSIFKKEKELRILVSSLEEKNKVLFELYQFGFELRSKRQIFYFPFENESVKVNEWIIVSSEGIYFVGFDFINKEEQKITVISPEYLLFLFQEQKLELIKDFDINKS